MSRYGTDIVTVSISTEPAFSVIEDNIAFVTVGASADLKECNRSTDITAFDANIQNAVKAVFSKTSLTKVFILTVVTGQEDQVKDLVENNGIYALIASHNSLIAVDPIKKLLKNLGVIENLTGNGRGLLFVPFNAKASAKPQYTQERLCYVGLLDYTATALWIAKVLTSDNKSVWHNVSIDYVGTKYSSTDLTTWGNDNINSFSAITYNTGYSEPTKMRANRGRCSTGKWIGNVVIADEFSARADNEGRELLVKQGGRLQYDARGTGVLELLLVSILDDLGEKGYLKQLGDDRQTNPDTYPYALKNNLTWNYSVAVPEQTSANRQNRRVVLEVGFETAGGVETFHVNTNIKEN